jgi:hypothetical protein
MMTIVASVSLAALGIGPVVLASGPFFEGVDCLMDGAAGW